MHQFDPIWLRRWQVCIDVIRTPWGVCVLGENAHLNRNDMDAKITPIKPRQSTIYPGSNLVISKATTISSRSNQLVSSLSFPNIRKRFDQVKFDGLFLTKEG